MFGKQLELYLAWKIHGRKPPQPETTGIKPRSTTRRCNPVRDEAYKAWIRTLPSIVSGKEPCEAAHTGNDGGMSMKASDTTCVPLTPEEHREYHRIGRRAFAKRYRIKFADACKSLRAAYRKERAA